MVLFSIAAFAVEVDFAAFGLDVFVHIDVTRKDFI
jgi:hypothetical protein